jgi:hypothetical protein
MAKVLRRMRVEELTEEQVAAFYEENPSLGHAFNHPKFLKTLAQSYRRELLYLGVFAASKLEAVGSFLLHRKGPIGVAQRLPIRYLGLASANPAMIPEHVLELRDKLGKLSRRVGLAHYNFPPHSEIIDIFSDESGCLEGIDVSIAQTNVLLLGDANEEGFLPSTSSRIRGRIRAAYRAGLTIRDSTREELRDVLPRFLEATYDRTHLESPYNEDLAWRLADSYHGDSSFQARTAVLESGQVAGMLIAVVHGDKAYSLCYAKDYSDETVRKLAVEEALVCDMVVRTMHLGCVEYDLGGGPEGIMESKRRLGAIGRPCVTVMVKHPLYEAALDLHEKAKRNFKPLRGRVSRFLADQTSAVRLSCSSLLSVFSLLQESPVVALARVSSLPMF